NVRTRSLASPQASSALSRASSQACSALPRYSPAIAPAADFKSPAADRKSSAALRAWVLLLCNLSCASVIPDPACSALFSSGIANLRLILSLIIRALLPFSKRDGEQIENAILRAGKVSPTSTTSLFAEND